MTYATRMAWINALMARGFGFECAVLVLDKAEAFVEAGYFKAFAGAVAAITNPSGV